MRILLIAAAVLLPSGVSMAQRRDALVELGRDVALLQEEVRLMNKNQNERLAQMEETLKAMQEQLAAANRALAVLDSGLKKRLEDSMVKPLSGVTGKVDSLSQDFGYVRETLAEINTRLGKLDQRITDLENAIRTMQAPPAPPAAATPAGPPPGVSAKSLYDSALRDKMGGNFDLALKEFNDYLAWFGDTEMAPNAQYYIGEILYNQKQYEEAIAAFDKVLEAYPKNPKTNDARLMKARALAQLGRRAEAEQEFRALIKAAPGSDAAQRARAELQKLTGGPARKR
ncbi:MAG: tetratricopeptide repeat protein [Bryobacteraceae bacterium]